jgi:phage terminase large subunit-like protein
VSPLGLAALQYDWSWWRRGKQVPPASSWRSWGLCTGRGFGKTRACAEEVLEEVREGHARRIALCAQNEDKTREVMVDGPSGLIRRSPPWARPVWRLGRLEWPNGALAFVYTPEVPGAMRGPEHDLAWVSEVVAWPPTTRQEALSNLRLGLRMGAARMLWDTTPKRRNPLVRMLLDRAAASPSKHIVVRGATRENADNLARDAIAEWESEYGGTSRGREELEGEFLDDVDGALFRQPWIDGARRAMPGKLDRCVVSVDPAISTRRNTDATGISVVGLGVDRQAFVLRDASGRMSPDRWTGLVLDLYREHSADCVVVERNRGGDLIVHALRASAAERGIRVEVVRAEAVTRHDPRVVYVKEVIATTSKESRAEVVVPAYQKGRVSHVDGADLASLEETMCTWDPSEGGASPNDLDALVYGLIEVLGLAADRKDFGEGMKAAPKMQAELSRSGVSAPARGVTAAMMAVGRGRTI